MVTAAKQLPDNSITVETREQGGAGGGDALQRIRQRHQVMETFWGPIHEVGKEDDRFVAGDQWPSELKSEREEDGRPCLTYNLFPSFTRQIINKVRQERPQLKVRPVESNRHVGSQRVKNLQGNKDYSYADVYSGIIRNIEHLSRADQAYDTALGHAVDHGFGYWMIVNRWSHADPFVQELVIKRVKNSYAVLLDPSAEEADFSDMQDAFVGGMIRRETFRKKYPKANPDSYGAIASADMVGWWDKDSIRVVNYYWLEHRKDEVLLLSNGATVYLSDVKDVLDDLEDDYGIVVANDGRGKDMRRDVRRPVCRWQKMTGSEILEGPTDLPFEWVPILAVFGDERISDGNIAYESATRHAKDPQRSYNYWRTAAAETVSLAPRAPYMLTQSQVQGHEHLYEAANRKNLPYLLYNHVDGVNPPQRQYPGGVSAAELQLGIQDAQDMQTIIGLHQANLGAESNEKSGRAIERRQQQGLTSTFQFPDNLARAQEHMGRILVNAIPKVYDTQRIMRIRLPDDTEDFVEINQRITDQESGKDSLVHDIAIGRYDVIMETGIDYATQRQEARDTQLEILKLVGPDVAGKIVHKVVENIGGPGADSIARILRKLLPDDLKSDEERRADLPPGVELNEAGQAVDEQGQPWQPPLTPAQQLMQQEQKVRQLEAEAEIAKSEGVKAKAEADKKKAEAELAQLTQGPEGEAARDDAQFLKDVEQIIRAAMEAHEGNQNAHADVIRKIVTDGNVQVLERVKAYIDRLIPKGADMTPAARDGTRSSQSAANAAGGGGLPAQPPPPQAPILVAMPAPASQRPKRVKFSYDANGNLAAGELVQQSEVIRFEPGPNGITQAVLETQEDDDGDA